jgi:putative ABC transport system permease protein
MAALPGVTGVARSTRLPVQNSGGTTTRFVEGYIAPAGTGNVELNYNLVDETYFETMGILVESGRAFVLDDGVGSNPIVIVNETAARRFWSNDGAVGGRVRGESAESPWADVVGVVGDSKIRTLDEPETPFLYFPLSRAAVGRLYFLVRTEADPTVLTAALRATVREIDPTLDVFEAGPLETHISTSLDPLRTGVLAMSGFSLLAILLASLGIYAVVSFVVARRTAEMGIRIALGAARRRIVGMVVRDVLVTVGVGMVVGLGLAALILPRVAEALFGVGGLDPVAFGGGAALFLAVSAVAAWIPARRAAHADPVEALRAS